MKKSTIFYCFLFLFSSFLKAQECISVDHKLRGYFYVGSSQKDTVAPGGFYVDNNVPREWDSKITVISKSKGLQIMVMTDQRTEFSKGVEGFKVYIVNTSDSIVKLPAEDSRIYMKRQVFYKNKWQDIEYLPSSWCGNSYHSVFIKPNQYWNLKAPCFKGKMVAKFRFQLVTDYVSKDGHTSENLIYSNEFDGSFNPKQLKKEQGYTPKGIMDPYNN